MITTVIYGRGKKTVIKKVKKSSEARVLLHECGDALSIPVHVLNNRKNICEQICLWEKRRWAVQRHGQHNGKKSKRRARED